MKSIISKEVEYLEAHFPFAKTDLLDIMAIDIETAPKPDATDPDTAALDYFTGDITLVGLVGYYDGVLVVEQYTPKDFNLLRASLKQKLDNGIKLTAHNGKFDFKFLIHNNIISYEDACKIWSDDSSILAAVDVYKIPDKWISNYEQQRQLINKTLPHNKGHRRAGPGSLKTLAPFLLGVETFYESTLDHNNSKYNLLDCLYTYYITAELQKKVGDISGQKCYSDLMERVKLLMRAELDGIKLDIPETKRRLEANALKIVELEKQIKSQWRPQFDKWEATQQDLLKNKYDEMSLIYANKHNKDLAVVKPKYDLLYEKAKSKANFELNLQSPDQLKWLLKIGLGYDITGFDGEESADKEVLSSLSETKDDVKVLMDYRKSIKLQSTYYPELLEKAKFDGRVHCGFNLTGARTGRLSASSPNLQNQPGHIHDLFIADDGNVLITKDLSALEPVLIAFFTEDPNLVDIVQRGISFHSVNAKEIFNLPCTIEEVAKQFPLERKAAKEFGLSILYGAGAKRVQQSLKKYGYNFDLTACKKMVYRIRDFYSGVWGFKTELDVVGEQGELVYNLFKRPILIQDKDDIYMTLFNSLIQGSGSDALLQAAVDLTKENSWIKLRLLVHDEMVVEVPKTRAEEAEKLVEYHMTKFELKTNLGDLKLQVEGRVDRTWLK